MPDIARPVPSSSDGSYTRPDTIQSRIAEKMKRMPRVNCDGHDLPPATADPSVITIVDAAVPAAPAAMLPNAAQGGGGVPVPTPAAGGSTLDRIAAELTRKLAPPIPEGYTPAPPR
jgi:hypothetical protein